MSEVSHSYNIYICIGTDRERESLVFIVVIRI